MLYFFLSFFVALAVFLAFEVFGINDQIENFILAFLEFLRNRGGKN